MTGFIAAHPVQFVIDTGADVTILSYRVYKELNRLGEIERLTADGVLKGLDGGRIEVVGTATLDFYLGEICVRQQVWKINGSCIERVAMGHLVAGSGFRLSLRLRMK